MLLDARNQDVSLNRRTEIAIIGAGPVGLTLARKLSDCGEILIVESGGLEVGPEISDLLDGECVGMPYPIRETRTHRFGGSTSLWAGYCALFDPIDFQSRSWVPRSGWPFDHTALHPYLREAAGLLNVRDFNFDAGNIAARTGDADPFTDDEVFLSVWRFGSPTLRIYANHAEEFTAMSRVPTLMNTTVTDLRLDDTHGWIKEFAVRTMNGRQGRIQADTVIMACGGMESARILLGANSQLPFGIGNGHGLVGRCFMEHPHLQLESLVVEDSRNFRHFLERGTYGDDHEFMYNIGISPEVQAREGILNSRIHVYRTPQMSDDEAPRLGVFLEQAPNPDSRIVLSEKEDALGRRRIRLDWRLTDLEWKSYRALDRLVSGALADVGVRRSARGSIARDDRRILHSNHHLGTTRLAADPAEGVVNIDARVHDVGNLYIMGGSVFPTVSWANPTLTLMALTLRLAQHLRTTCYRERTGSSSSRPAPMNSD